MNDIVESLHYWALPPAGETREPENAELLKWAAIEIERLRQETLVQSEAIETLRGLLRDGLEKHERYPGGYAAMTSEPGLFEYWKRVRETLGE